MRTQVLIAGCLPLVAGLACGSSGSTVPPADTSTVAQYQSLALELQSSLMAYGGAMVTAPSLDACRAAHDRYDAEVRPRIVKMADLSKSMDAFMETHAGDMLTDMSCVTSAMMDELDQHRSVACSSDDAATNRTEVDRHVGAMAAYDAHAQDRCQTMMQAGTTSMKWSPMMQGCQYYAGQ
jgi:hypothetical protein